SWRRACGHWWRRESSPVPLGAIAWCSRSRACRYQPRCRQCWRRASTGSYLRRNASCRWPRSLGPRCPWQLLQATAEASEEALHRGLAHLQAAEFLYETHLFPERAYTFKHALTHEVAYGGLL